MTQELDSVFEMLERGLNSGKLDGENQRKGGKKDNFLPDVIMK